MSRNKFSDAVRYTKEHDWITIAAPYRIGISDFAQEQLGDLTYAELPAVGTTLDKGEEFGTLESTKAVSSLYAPVACTVVAVNSAIENDPGLVNADPYDDGWLIEVTVSDPAQLETLLDMNAYEAFLAEEEH